MRAAWLGLMFVRVAVGAPDEACLRGERSFAVGNPLAEAHDQTYGTCYGEGPTTLIEEALWREQKYEGSTAPSYRVSTDYVLCNFLRRASREDLESRSQAVVKRGKNFVDTGRERVVLHDALSGGELRTHRREIQAEMRKVYDRLTEAARDGKLTVERRRCLLNEGKRRCDSLSAPLRLESKLLRSFDNVHVVGRADMDPVRGEEFKENGRPGVATDYIRFLETLPHPEQLAAYVEEFEANLNESALARWRNAHTVEDLRALRDALVARPAELLRFPVGRAAPGSELFAKIFGPPSAKEFPVESLAGLFVVAARDPENARSGYPLEVKKVFPEPIRDFHRLLPALDAKYRRLAADCERGSAAVRAKLLKYLCTGIPVMVGADMWGVRVGEDRLPLKTAGFGSVPHVMILNGVYRDPSGRSFFRFRNSWGEALALALMPFDNACQILDASVLITPSDRARLQIMAPELVPPAAEGARH